MRYLALPSATYCNILQHFLALVCFHGFLQQSSDGNRFSKIPNLFLFNTLQIGIICCKCYTWKCASHDDVFLVYLAWKSINLILFLTWFDAKSLWVEYSNFSLFYSLFLYHKWCSKWSIQSFFPLNRISRNGWFINLKGNTLSNWSGDRQRRISWSSSFSHNRNRRRLSENYSHVG